MRFQCQSPLSWNDLLDSISATILRAPGRYFASNIMFLLSLHLAIFSAISSSWGDLVPPLLLIWATAVVLSIFSLMEQSEKSLRNIAVLKMPPTTLAHWYGAQRHIWTISLLCYNCCSSHPNRSWKRQKKALNLGLMLKRICLSNDKVVKPTSPNPPCPYLKGWFLLLNFPSLTFFFTNVQILNIL